MASFLLDWDGDVFEPVWLFPSGVPDLRSHEVHIWRACLNVSPDRLQHYRQTLSLDERQRADRFRFERDRCWFMASRGILREILAGYLGTAPEQLKFCYGERGKPALDSASGLEFNLSHSQDIMVCAIAQGSRVGIDLEYLRPVSDLEHLTQRFFSEPEYAAIMAVPPDQRLPVFFQYWTMKEALLKAVGQGLVGLSSVEVALTDGVAKLVRFAGDRPSIAGWSLQLFTPASDFIATVAVDLTDTVDVTGLVSDLPSSMLRWYEKQ